MGVRELREAFNGEAGSAARCMQAYLGYKNAGGTQWQILTFEGSLPDGSPFRIVSDQIRPNGDVIVAARSTAQTLLKNPETYKVGS